MKLFKKQTKQQAPLTDAELQQATGGTRADVARRIKAKQESCNAYTNQSDCQSNDCKWKENSKDTHDCSY